MTIKRGRSLYSFVCLLAALYFSGCAGTVKHMNVVPPNMIVAAPSEGKSMVVFMRPSGIGFAVQSSVFEIKGDHPSLVGIVAAKKKVIYELEPGSHLFMVRSAFIPDFPARQVDEYVVQGRADHDLLFSAHFFL